MDIRAYEPKDRDGCLAVFDSLEGPYFFTPEGREEFAAFLDRAESPYLVLEHDGCIVGCGGYHAEPGAAIAALHWGMIARGAQRQGLGRYLLLYRMKEIGRVPGVQMVNLGTTAGAAPFFEKFAFRKVKEDDAGLVTMRMKLQVCP